MMILIISIWNVPLEVAMLVGNSTLAPLPLAKSLHQTIWMASFSPRPRTLHTLGTKGIQVHQPNKTCGRGHIAADFS